MTPPVVKGPQRIVCLTEETVETLYLLGQQDRIVGVTGYAVRPPQVRQEKPRVGAFTTADVPKIQALNPDLVLTFSDLQADIAAELIRSGLSVLAFNQRSVAGILDMIETLGALTGSAADAQAIIDRFDARRTALETRTLQARPRVWFEEWDEPLISAIGWVSELIAIAGGEDVFAPLARKQDAQSRIVSEAQIIEAQPDIIIGSWCGKKVRPERIMARQGWGSIPAVQNERVYEIKSPLLLAPGPAALTEGLEALVRVIDPVANRQKETVC